ncbi:MAG: putative sugar O-methyltransferase [Rhodospirillales bacterium]|jgi:hypothetical protein
MLKYLKNFVRGSEALHLMISRAKAEHDADKAKKAYYHVTDDDDVTVAAYELFISAIVPKFLKVPAKDAEIFKRIWASYNKALDIAVANQANEASYLAGGWQTMLLNVRERVLKEDFEFFFATLGARIYNSGKLNFNDRFMPLSMKGEVAKTLSILKGIRNIYPQAEPTQGYTSYFYPHFHLNGTPINPLDLYGLETILFLAKHYSIAASHVVAEIGAGDGAVCRDIVGKFGCKYVIFDLPEVLFRSQLFLSKHYAGSKRVGGLVEYLEHGRSLSKAFEEFDILCLPAWEAEHVDVGVRTWINTHSLGEMPVEVARRYCRIIAETGEGFFSVNEDHGVWAGHYQHHSSKEYLDIVAGRMELQNAGYVFSSTFNRLKPYYVRHFFTKK